VTAAAAAVLAAATIARHTMGESTSTESGGGGGSAAYRTTMHAVIEVADTGAGISPNDHSKVFGAFAQFRANELQVTLPHLSNLSDGITL